MESDSVKNCDRSDVNKISDPKSGSDSTLENDFNAGSCKDSTYNHKGTTEIEELNQEINQMRISEDDSDEDEYSDAKDASNDLDELDEEAITESQKNLSEDELEKLKEEAASLKNKGNEHFKKAEYKESVSLYTAALNVCPLKYQSDRAILYANRAAARISIEQNEEAVLDCNKAIELNPSYLKAIIRRAQLHRKMDSLEKALEDYKRILELDRNNSEAREACMTLPPQIAERNEKLKNEMFGKLKELGNMCLKPFGFSTDNFKVVQDPNSGGYSINFQNNAS